MDTDMFIETDNIRKLIRTIIAEFFLIIIAGIQAVCMMLTLTQCTGKRPKYVVEL